MKKKRTCQRVEFGELPPRVIVYDILGFFLFTVNEYQEKHCLYGYFERDRLRNIWMVFTSVLFDKRTKKVFMDIKRIRYIFFQGFYEFSRTRVKKNIGAELLSRLFVGKYTEEMYSLEGFRTKYVDLKPSYIKELEKLKNLNNVTLRIPTEQVWKSSISLQSLFLKLKSLDLYCESHQLSSFLSNSFPSSLPLLKTLRIRRFTFETKKLIEIPLLEEVKLMDVINLYIIPGNILKSIDLTRIDDECSQNLFSASNKEKLKRLCFSIQTSFGNSNSCISLLSPSMKSLTEIELYLNNHIFLESELNVWNQLGHKLEKIRMKRCDFDIDLFQNNPSYSSLTSLYLDDCSFMKENMKSVNWPLSETLLYLLLVDRGKEDHFIFDSILFVQNEFPQLLGLDISFNKTYPKRRKGEKKSTEVIPKSQKDWKPFNNLRKLELRNLERLDDSFFKKKTTENGFRNLKEVTLCNLKMLRGTLENWDESFFASVEILRVCECPLLEKRISSTSNKFENLKELVVEKPRRDLTYPFSHRPYWSLVPRRFSFDNIHLYN